MNYGKLHKGFIFQVCNETVGLKEPGIFKEVT